MKIRDGFVLTEVADDYVAVPTGDAADCFCGIVRLNDSGAAIFSALQKGLDQSQIAQKLVEKYQGLDSEKALASVNAVVNKLREAGILED